MEKNFQLKNQKNNKNLLSNHLSQTEDLEKSKAQQEDLKYQFIQMIISTLQRKMERESLLKQEITFDELNEYIQVELNQHKDLITSTQNQHIFVIFGLSNQAIRQFAQLLEEPEIQNCIHSKDLTQSSQQQIEINRSIPFDEELRSVYDVKNSYFNLNNNDNNQILFPRKLFTQNHHIILEFPGFVDRQELKHSLLNAYLQKQILESASSVRSFLVIDESSLTSQRGKDVKQLISFMSRYTYYEQPKNNYHVVLLNAERTPQECERILERDWADYSIIGDCLKNQRIYRICKQQNSGNYKYFQEIDKILKGLDNLSDNTFKKVNSEALFSKEILEQLNETILMKLKVSYEDQLQEYSASFVKSTKTRKEKALEVLQTIRRSDISCIIEATLNNRIKLFEKDNKDFQRSSKQRYQQIENEKEIDSIKNYQQILKWILMFFSVYYLSNSIVSPYFLRQN